MRKRLLSLGIALLIIIAGLSPVTEAYAKDYSNLGCVQWVKDRAAGIGISLPATGTNKYGLYGASAYWDKLAGTYQRGSQPAKYSLAVWEFNNGTDGAGGKYGHVAFVEDVNGDNVTVTEGGCRGYSYQGNNGVICRTQSKSKMATLGNCSGFYGYIYLKGAPSQSQPRYSSIGLDFTDNWNAGLKGKIENPNRAKVSSVGAYVWDPSGNKIVNHTEACNLSTSTVNQTLNIVGETSLKNGLKQGTTYTFQLWANVGGTVIYSGKGSFTTTDITKPVISDAKVTNITSNGYTVSCTATDNVGVNRVVFPTWTENNSQDDLDKNWVAGGTVKGTKNGNTYSCDIKISDHNNECGRYITHVYAFDNAGNNVCFVLGSVTVPSKSDTSAKVSKPKTPVLKAVKAGKKKMTVNWKKVNSITGYQVQYATNKGMTQNRKTVTVAKASATGRSITKLKSKKIYYVRVRAYKKVKGKTYYSKWSSIKKVKVK